MLIATSTPLTVDEKIKLSQLEKTIERGIKAFHEAGQALLEIREFRLHRERYDSFEDYCREQWGMSRAQAYRLIEASEVIVNLSPIGDILPVNEAQCRPLTPLEPEQQREAWVNALSQSPNPTANQVQAAVERVTQRAAIAPGSKIRVTGKHHHGAELEVAKTENSGALVYAKLPSGESYPFLAGEVEVVEAAPAPMPKPKPDYKQQNQQFRDLLSRCLPYLPTDLMQEVEEAISG